MTQVHFLNNGKNTDAYLIDGDQVTVERTDINGLVKRLKFDLQEGRRQYRLGLALGMEKGCAVRRMTTQAEVDSYIASRYDMESDNGPEAALAESEDAFYALKEDGFYEVAI